MRVSPLRRAAAVALVTAGTLGAVAAPAHAEEPAPTESQGSIGSEIYQNLPQPVQMSVGGSLVVPMLILSVAYCPFAQHGECA